MDRMLQNHKEVMSRKALRRIQKQSIREYKGGKSISKTKIGKIVERKGVQEHVYIPTGSLSKHSVSDLITALKNVHLTGMSGNDFPVSEKIERILKCPSRILIVNGVECEPGLIHDRWLLENAWAQIKSGIETLQEMVGFQRCILAYSMKRTQPKNKRSENTFEICHVPARYPMGEEHYLIKQLLGTEIKKEEYPVDKGILVLNVQTIFQIFCVLAGAYQNGRYITAANMNTGEASVVYVERNANIKQKVREIFAERAELPCFAGHGMMYSHEVTDTEVFLDSTCFVAIGKPANITNQNACKGCGRCNRKCPSGVRIREIVKRREKNMQADISDLGLENCIHCGSCTYFCKAGKNTMAYFD